MLDDRDPHLSFSKAPPADGKDPKWRVHRVKPGRPLKAICLSHEMVGHLLHYAGGRSRPHFDGACSWCDDGKSPPRWYGYLAAVNLELNEPRLLEVTQAGGLLIDRYLSSHRSLRAVELTLSRKDAKANGELHVVLRESRFDGDRLPVCPNVVRMLMRMWGFPDDGPIATDGLPPGGFTPKDWRRTG
jgi:hypothetical protein